MLSPTATLTDTATLTGGTTQPPATGTITFTLYGPFDSAPGANSCIAGKVVDTRSVDVTGNKQLLAGDRDHGARGGLLHVDR